MSELRLAAAILIPWIAGTCVSRAALAGRNRLEHVAAGWFVGQLLVAFLLAVLLRAGIEVGGATAMAPVVLVAGVAFVVARLRRPPVSPLPVGEVRDVLLRSPLARVAAFLTLLSLAVKAVIVFAEWAWAPILHDDAIVIWLFRAKVIAGLGRLPLDPADPYYFGGTHPDYPLFASLLPAWVALVCGAWRESWVTLPWALTYVCMPLLTAALLSQHIGAMRAGLVAYAVASIPLLVLHAMRPGYADLSVAAFLLAATLYLIDWRTGGGAASLAMGIAFGIGAAWMKREGVFPAACAAAVLVAPGLLRGPRAQRLDRRVALAGVAVAAAALAWGLDWRFLRDSLAGGGYHADVPAILWRHLFSWESFGVLWFVVVGAAGLLLASGEGTGRTAAVYGLLLMAYAAGVFVLTDNARFARNDQTPSRVFLQLAPAVIAALAFGWARGRDRPTR